MSNLWNKSSRLTVFFLLMLAWLGGCKKNNDPTTQTGSGFCKEVTISSLYLKFSFKFTFDDQLRIVGLTVDEGTPETRNYTYGSDGKLNDPSGDITTDYKNGVLDAVFLDGALFAFNPGGQLVSTRITTGAGESLYYTYTYDANGDPTAIKGIITTANGGTESDNYVLDYLADHLTGLPGTQQPQFAWVSTYFTAVPMTSKHLLNKWVRNWTAAGRSYTFTQQYTYQFDAQNRLTQFVHTGNANNIYKITYAQCP